MLPLVAQAGITPALLQSLPFRGGRVKTLLIRSAAAIAVATALALPARLAATPQNTLVVVWAIDDILTMVRGRRSIPPRNMGNAYDS